MSASEMHVLTREGCLIKSTDGREIYSTWVIQHANQHTHYSISSFEVCTVRKSLTCAGNDYTHISMILYTFDLCSLFSGRLLH